MDGWRSLAFDINDSGVIVGYSISHANGSSRATIWSDGAAIDLNSKTLGWLLLSGLGVIGRTLHSRSGRPPPHGGP